MALAQIYLMTQPELLNQALLHLAATGDVPTHHSLALTIVQLKVWG